MKNITFFLIITVALAGALFLANPPTQKNRSAEVLLGAALHQEEVEGNLEAAIETYKKILAEYPNNKPLAAKALLQMGQCYEKLGKDGAHKAYERLLSQYADQNEVAAEARVRLTALERAGSLGHQAGITLRKVWTLTYGGFRGSPSLDGRYHSFVDRETGDLALRDLIAGQNRRLTNKGTWKDSEESAEGSVISGDGRQIAYAWYNKEKFYELRVIGIDGSNPRTIYRDKQIQNWLEPFQWTADGKQILVALMQKKDECQFAFIPVAGGPARFLQIPSKGPWGASLSPDGRFLVYGAAGEKDDPSDIYLLSLEDGQEVPLVRSPADEFNPIWMPGGKKVLFVSDQTGTRGFWTIEVAEGKPRGLPQLLKDGVSGVDSDIMPNGFTRRGDFYYATNTAISDVYLAELDPVDGKVLRQPKPITPRFVGANSTPSWSPDGRRLAYYRRGDTRAVDPTPALKILSIETGEVREVPLKLRQLLYHVCWYPDGKSVMVNVWDGPSEDEIAFYQVDIETGENHLIRNSHSYGCGNLAPDGRSLIFWTGGERKDWGGILARDLETGQEREIGRVPYLGDNGWGGEAISPDSKFLAFRSPVDEHQGTAIRLIPISGGEIRELFRFRQSEATAGDDIAWTPDGRNVLFVRCAGKDCIPELWRIPIAGGEPQRTGLSSEGLGLVAPHPDGRRIAFGVGRPSGTPSELWVLENIPGVMESKAVAGAK